LSGVPPGNYVVHTKKANFDDTSIEAKVVAGYATQIKIIIKKSSVENHPPTKPSNPNPPDQAAIQQTNSVLSWECSDPDGDAISYDVFYGTSNPPTEKIAANSSDRQVTIGNMQIGKTYFWLVVAKDSKGATTYGDIWKLMVTEDASNKPPTKPSNPIPRNNSIINSTNTVLTWDCSDPDGDAVKYDIYFSNRLVASDVTDKMYNPGTLGFGYTYNWQIYAKDTKGAVTIGDLWTFKVERTNQAPAKASNPYPANNSTITNSKPTMTWDCSDPDNDTIFYDVCFGDGKGYWTVVSANQKGRTYTPSLPLSKGYPTYWKIVSKDGYGAITDGDMWKFTVALDNRAPAVPSSPNPTIGQIVTTSAYTFSWACSDPDGDAISYNLHYKKENGGWFIQTNLSSQYFLVSELADNTKYIWKIVATDTKGALTESPEWHFTTKFGTSNFFDKIIAYYQFNGNTNDASSNAFHGKNNSVTFASDRKGNSNSCGYFGNGNEYVDVPYPEAFNFKGDFTIAMWVKPNLSICKDWDTHIDIIVKPENVSKWLTFGITRNLGLEYWTNQQFIGYDMTTLKDMQWNHIAVTFIKGSNGTTGTARLYLNGTQLGATKTMPLATNNTGNLWIGARPGFNASFGGWLDDLYFFNRALSDSEIQSIAK
jgi:hypothetical protein